MSMFKSPNDVSSSVNESSNTSDLQTNQRVARSTSSHLSALGLSKTRDIHGSSTSAAVTRVSSLQIQNLQPHQRQGLLQLAFVEARCHDAAFLALNKHRNADAQLSRDDPEVEEEAMKTYSELVTTFNKTLMLPDELTGPEGKQLRQSTLTGLDSMLYNSTVNRINGLESVSASFGTPSLNPSSGVRDTMPLQNLQLAPPARFGASAPSLMMGNNTSLFANPSPYKDEHQELCILGKGGYGQVWKVRNHLDNQLYAVKKIVITSQRLQRFSQDKQVEALLAELRTLAKLHHTNVVRYYHGWIEKTDPLISSVSTFSSSPHNLLEGPSTTEDSSSRKDDRDSFEDDNLDSRQAGRGLSSITNSQTPWTRGRIFEEVEDDGGVVFGEDSISQDQDTIPTSARNRRASRNTNSSTQTFTKASLHTVGKDEDEVEVIPRSPNRQLSLSHVQQSRGPSPDRLDEQIYQGPDITLFIKMSLHPTTLSSFLSPDPPHPEEEIKLRHCFHQQPSVQMLAALLDGVEYLHSQRIVHRDLKPANIFLSVHKDRPPATSGYVNISSCEQCKTTCGKLDTETEAIYLTPCIGDFGLIAEMKDEVPPPLTPDSPRSTDPSSSAGFSTFEPSPLAQLQAERPVGTQFYRPNKMPSQEPKICPKLDVYSLGVITFELLCKLDTKSERAIKLTELGKGKLPADFRAHAMASGVLCMVKESRDERWDCSQVRDWLQSARHSS